MKIERIYY